VAAGDVDDEHEDPPFRQPLPKDDRLWRHPSELDDAPRPAGWRPFRRHHAGDPATRAN
jgi:hypothetical protein